jgi:DedD protein
MISFLKFKKKNSTEANQSRTEPSMQTRRQVVSDDDQEELSENPEVQRSRHRLLGAGFLLLLAIVGLPRVFDSEPKKIKNDVVLKVVSSVSDAANTVDEKKITTITPTTPTTPVVPEETVVSSTKKTEIAETKTNKNNIDNGEVVISESKVKEADKSKAKFYIQVAAYSSNDRVKKMSSKLQELKITSYVIERKKESDGTSLYLLRSGPYTSRDDAQVVVKKMVELELAPKIIEMKTPQ